MSTPGQDGRPLRIVTFSTLYPNAVQIRHGIFVEQRLRQLLASAPERCTARVLAPVPWFPSSHPRFGQYADYARVPRVETRHGLSVLHPRYPVIPKVGMNLAPWLLAHAGRKPLQRLEREQSFELIDAHYFYPDGVAAALLGRRLGKPVVITARGADVNQITNHPLPRRLIRWAAGEAAGLITVATALKQRLVDLGVAPERITVLRNGVDLDLFRPLDYRRQRERLGLRGPTLVSVGLLIPRKGHDLTIRALAELPDHRLLIIGDGPEGPALRRLAGELGVAGRIEFIATLPQQQLKEYYSAADAMVLASSSEGWANVLLEAMACGTPVVASRVSGTPEAVTAPEAGVLIDERSPVGIAAAVRRLAAARPDRAATRRYAERFGWGDTSAGQLALFQRIINERNQT